MAVPLKIYRGEDGVRFRSAGDLNSFDNEFDDDDITPAAPSVRLRLGDLLPLVAMAQRMNFIWLKDFLDDEITVTQDLHEVLQTLRSVRPSAG